MITMSNHVGARIRARREELGLTKGQLARLAGVNESQLRQWERGDHVPTAKNLLRLIEHLGGSLDEFLLDADWPLDGDT